MSTEEDGRLRQEHVEATAAVWLSLRDRGMTEAETAEFMQWLQQAPAHAEVFAELDALWKRMDRLGERGAGADVPGAVRARRPGLWRRWSLVAGMAAAAALGLFLVGVTRPDHTVETAVGAFQKLDLPDGSVVQMNTDSAIEVRYTEGLRRVVLVRGEAHFDVAKNPARPFVVTVGPVEFQALGTAFNVRRRDAGVELLVTEGRVSVESPAAASTAEAVPVVTAGHRAWVDTPGGVFAGARVFSVAGDEYERSLAWQERRLQFDALPLSEVVAEFNRYNQIKLVIVDDEIGTQAFSGAFRADGYQAFVRLLEESFGIEATRLTGVIELRRERAR